MQTCLSQYKTRISLSLAVLRAFLRKYSAHAHSCSTTRRSCFTLSWYPSWVSTLIEAWVICALTRKSERLASRFSFLTSAKSAKVKAMLMRRCRRKKSVVRQSSSTPWQSWIDLRSESSSTFNSRMRPALVLDLLMSFSHCWRHKSIRQTMGQCGRFASLMAPYSQPRSMSSS